MTGVSTSCGACKFLRRKCTSECVFRPYFSYNEATSHFSAVHKVFGASNVSRLLLHLPEQFRNEAAFSITYEALARMRDPVYGCVSYIYALQQEVANLQEEIEVLENHMANASIIESRTNDQFWGSQQAATNNDLITNDQPIHISSSDETPMMNLQEYWTSSSTYHQQEQLSNNNGEDVITMTSECDSLNMERLLGRYDNNVGVQEKLDSYSPWLNN